MEEEVYVLLKMFMVHPGAVLLYKTAPLMEMMFEAVAAELFCIVMLKLLSCVFSNNTCKNNGGGININVGAILHMKNSYSRGNNCGGNGKGVYVLGLFKISGNTYMDSQNEVYLTKNTYIDVVGKLNKSSGNC